MTDDGTSGESSAETEVTSVELPAEHPAIAPLSFLLGRWKGTGKGDYPTIKPFNFLQEVAFSHIGKPYLIYTSRSWRLATDEQGRLQAIINDATTATSRFEHYMEDVCNWGLKNYACENAAGHYTLAIRAVGYDLDSPQMAAVGSASSEIAI